MQGGGGTERGPENAGKAISFISATNAALVVVGNETPSSCFMGSTSPGPIWGKGVLSRKVCGAQERGIKAYCVPLPSFCSPFVSAFLISLFCLAGLLPSTFEPIQREAENEGVSNLIS